MTFFFGLIGLIQSAFLPGFIIKKIFFDNFSTITFLPFIFFISLITTWIIIFILTIFGLYLKSILLVITIFEIGSIIFLYRKIKFANIITFNVSTTNHSLLKIINFFLVIFTFWIFINHIGDIYTNYDAVVSYNGRWAGSWFENKIPTNSLFYPQLLPANMSLSNVLIELNTMEMQFFSFSLCLSFIPITSLMAGAVVRLTKNEMFYIVNIFFLILLNTEPFDGLFNQVILYNGYMDIPVACFTLISIGLFFVGCSYATSEKNKKIGMNFIILSSMLAAGAAATKQSGLVIALLNLVAVMYWAKNVKISAYRLLYKVLLIHFFVYGIWYLSIIYKIYFQNYDNEVELVQSIQSPFYLERIKRAVGIYPHYYYIALALLPSLLIPFHRWSTIIIFLSLFIWTFFFSYDFRNFIPTYPFIAFSLASMTFFIINLSKFKLFFFLNFIKFPMNDKYFKFSKTFRIKINYILINTAIICLLIGYQIYPSDHALYNDNEYKRRLIMPIQYSESIYKAWDKHGIAKIITSQKSYIARLPKMIDRVVDPYDFEDHSNKNLEYFNFLINNSEANFLLVSSENPFKPSKSIKQKIHQLIYNKKIELVIQEANVKVYLLIK